MNKKKTTSAVAVLLALAIALGGTFAWQSISQQARNEAETFKNPGGRLHDDFSGWYETGHNEGVLTKDIYVENFGNQPIFARVRLDEFMEIGTGAGLMPGEDGYVTKDVEPLEAYARIDDVTTWRTHLPVGAVAADPAASPAVTAAPANLGNDPDEGLAGIPGHVSFHEYWTWTMGGEDTVNNPDGKTVYMPTFNKNGDSLAPDINGTMDGKNAKDKSQYDDWVKYTAYKEAVTDEDGKVVTPASGSSATRVRDESKDGDENYIVPDGAFYDADDNTVDEGLGQGYGNGGVQNTNYTVVEETHYAKETEAGGVCTMAEWNEFTKREKDAHGWWVYDVDGWAYWSRPIEPDAATGLLMDRLTPTQKLLDMNEDWYYGINAVGQFITADDLGIHNNTGFYEDPAREPSEDALDMLESIGVDTTVSGAAGSIRVEAATFGVNSDISDFELHSLSFVTPNTLAYLDPTICLDGQEPVLAYSLYGNDGLPAVDDWAVAADGRSATNDTFGLQVTLDGGVDSRLAMIDLTDYSFYMEADTEVGRFYTFGLEVGPNETVGSELTVTVRGTSPEYAGLKGVLKLPVEKEEYHIEIIMDENDLTIDGRHMPMGYYPYSAFYPALVSNAGQVSKDNEFRLELVGTYQANTHLTGRDSSGQVADTDTAVDHVSTNVFDGGARLYAQKDAGGEEPGGSTITVKVTPTAAGYTDVPARTIEFSVAPYLEILDLFDNFVDGWTYNTTYWDDDGGYKQKQFTAHTNVAGTVVWSSSDETVATVDQTGKVTMVGTQGPVDQAAVITASVQNAGTSVSSSFTAQIYGQPPTVTVNGNTVGSGDTISVDKGSTVTLGVAPVEDPGDVTWQLSANASTDFTVTGGAVWDESSGCYTATGDTLGITISGDVADGSVFVVSVNCEYLNGSPLEFVLQVPGGGGEGGGGTPIQVNGAAVTDSVVYADPGETLNVAIDSTGGSTITWYVYADDENCCTVSNGTWDAGQYRYVVDGEYAVTITLSEGLTSSNELVIEVYSDCAALDYWNDGYDCFELFINEA